MNTNDLRRRVGLKAGKMQYLTEFALHLMMALKAAISQGSFTGFTRVEKKRIFFWFAVFVFDTRVFFYVSTACESQSSLENPRVVYRLTKIRNVVISIEFLLWNHIVKD